MAQASISPSRRIFGECGEGALGESGGDQSAGRPAPQGGAHLLWKLGQPP